MPRLAENIRVPRAEALLVRAMVEGMKNRPGMYLITNTLAEAMGRLSERLFRSPLHDWLREWLAHNFDLDCECAWEAMALHLVSGATAKKKHL